MNWHGPTSLSQKCKLGLGTYDVAFKPSQNGWSKKTGLALTIGNVRGLEPDPGWFIVDLLTW